MLAATVLLCAGCSLALKTDEEQCTVDHDCELRGSAFAGTICMDHVCQAKPVPVDPKWGCVGNVSPLPSGTMDTLSAQLVDLISNDPPANMTVKLCNKYDTMCGTPLGTPQPDATGKVTVTISSDIEAYLDVTAPGYYPSIIFFEHAAQAKNPVVFILPTGAVDAIAATAKVTLDPTKGILLVRNTDCQLGPTAGASVTMAPHDMDRGFYVIGSAATLDATQTDNSGNSGFLNVDPGTPTVTGTIGPMGKEFGKVTTLVRTGYVTDQILRPTPTL